MHVHIVHTRYCIWVKCIVDVNIKFIFHFHSTIVLWLFYGVSTVENCVVQYRGFQSLPRSLYEYGTLTHCCLLLYMYSVHVFVLSKVSLQLDSHNQNHSYSICILRHSFHFVFFMLCSSYANHPPAETCVIPLFPGTGHTQQRSLTLKAATSAAYVSLSACIWHTLCLTLQWNVDTLSLVFHGCV